MMKKIFALLLVLCMAAGFAEAEDSIAEGEDQLDAAWDEFAAARGAALLIRNRILRPGERMWL